MPAFAAGQSLQLGFDAGEGDQVVTDIAFRIARMHMKNFLANIALARPRVKQMSRSQN